MQKTLTAVAAVTLLLGTGASQAQSDLSALERMERQLSSEVDAKRQKEAQAKAEQEKSKSLTFMVEAHKKAIINAYDQEGPKISPDGYKYKNPRALLTFPWDGDIYCRYSSRDSTGIVRYSQMIKPILEVVMYPIVQKVASPKYQWGSPDGASWLLREIKEAKQCGDPAVIKDVDAAIRMAESIGPELAAAVEAREKRLARDAEIKQAAKDAEEAAEAAKKQMADAEQAAHIDALRSGKTPVRSAADAAILFGATPGEMLIVSPPLKADGKVYSWFGPVDKVNSSTEFFVRTKALNKTGFALARLNSKSKVTSEPRQGAHMFFVGRFTGTIKVRMTSGEERVAPAFEILYMGII